MSAGSGPDQLDGKGVGWGGCSEEAGVEFWHLCDTLVTSPGLLEVFSLFLFCFLFKVVRTGPVRWQRGGGGGGERGVS